MTIKEIKGIRDKKLLTQLTDLWEKSIRSSHNFLNEADIKHLKSFVNDALYNIKHLIVAWQNNIPTGFIGIENNKIDMLFLSPDHTQQGIGSKLLDLAVCSYEARYADVSEQNTTALQFYTHKGFRIIQRDETDNQGNPFPILHLQKTGHTHITKIYDNKKQHLDLLLIGDEQENMIDRYLNRGEMFIMHNLNTSEPICVAVIIEQDSNTCELKNIAVNPTYQRNGYGKQMLNYLCHRFSARFQTLIAGTGDTPSTTTFYKHCGFKYSHSIKNFFTENYDHIIIEDGKILTDMVYFSKQLH